MAPASYIMEQLNTILNDASEPTTYPVGILTTEHRDTWTKMRETLASGKQNREKRYFKTLCMSHVEFYTHV